MKLLLTSVFRPFGVDDAYGRKENKLELFHNQVTREQGIFSLRYNHRSFGLYFIAENLSTPTTVLDFPSIKQFRKELAKGYDYVGISFIAPNFVKARRMAEIIREVSPQTKIILGGHGSRIPDIETLIDCDHVLPGEGISKLRKLLGEDMNAPIKHPAMPAADHKRILGLPFTQQGAVLVPGVGCPNACRFCCTSHFYDKEYTPFLKTGKDIFDVCVRLADELKTNDFFVMDENFLLHKDRAMELLALMREHNRPFNFSVFSSAEAITAFGVDNMMALGVNYVWIGVESKQNLFEKTKGIDVQALIAELRANGIFVLASSILFLEHHDKESINEDIDFAISLKPDFTQFMQLGPLPQTRLYLEYKEQGLLLDDVPYEEWHGQHMLWFKHPHFTREESAVATKEAFAREFRELGPSILRVGEAMIQGLDSPHYKSGDPFMAARYETAVRRCKAYRHALTALKWLAPEKQMKEKAGRIEAMFAEKFGTRTPAHFIANSAVWAMANTARLKYDKEFHPHNPRAIVTRFRMEPAAVAAAACSAARATALLKLRKAWAFIEKRGEEAELSVYLRGSVKEKTMRRLINALNEKKIAVKAVHINLAPLARLDSEAFGRMLESLSRKGADIKINCSEAHARQMAALRKRLKGLQFAVNER